MDLSLLSLMFLIGAIVIGLTCKKNTGLVAIGLSLILGTIGNMPVKEIMAGFPTSLFMTLLGVMLLFSISQENGTLELLAKKTVSISGKKTYLIPIIVYVFSTVLSAIGPGTIPVMSLMAVFTCALAHQMNISPLLISSTALIGATAGGISPIAPTGIIGIMLAAEQGITGIDMPFFYNSLISQTIYFIVIYIVFGGYKMKSDVVLDFKEIPAFNKNQKITLVGMLSLVIGVIGFNLHVGMLSFTISLVLLLLNVANEKISISHVPWGTLLLVCGVNVLMSIVIKLGGINLLAHTLASFMIPSTAPMLTGLTSGIISWFSSTSGVVMPTLIPTVTTIIEKVGGNVSALALISAITNTSHIAGISPISTGGSLVVAAYAQHEEITEKDQQKLFVNMFLVAIAGVLVVSLVAGTGIYTLFE